MSDANHEVVIDHRTDLVDLVDLLHRVERALELASALACPASDAAGKYESLLANAATAHLAFDQLRASVVETANRLEQCAAGGNR